MAQTWRKIDAMWLLCHWWQDPDERRLPAMTFLILTAAVLILITVALVREIRADGRGRRTAPRSHLAWHETTALGSGSR